jgi:hypothetical protein
LTPGLQTTAPAKGGAVKPVAAGAARASQASVGPTDLAAEGPAAAPVAEADAFAGPSDQGADDSSGFTSDPSVGRTTDAAAGGESAAVSGADPSAQAPGQGAAAAQPAIATASANPSAQATPATATHLAAQIVSRTDGRSSRFDVQLDPAGLGQVTVSVEIDSRGRLSAALSFDRPDSAAALKQQSGVLQAALEKAGFDLSGGGLSFDSPGSGGQRSPSDEQTASFRAGRAFDTAANAAIQTERSVGSQTGRALGGLDIRI